MSYLSSAILAGLSCLALVSPRLSADTAPVPQERDRVTDRTYVFCRAQWKYGLERDDYLNRWVDRPLFVDPSLKLPPGSPGIQYPGFEKTQEVVARYRLDGMGLFPETGGRPVIYDYATRFGKNSFQLITELTATPRQSFSRSQAIEKALENPASFRINGRVVIIVDIADTQPLEYWQGVVTKLRKQFGDRFAFVPGVMRPAGISLHTWHEKYRTGTLSDEDQEAASEYYRKWARMADGLYFPTCDAIVNERRRFAPDFYRDFVIATIKGVLSEPEFQGKLFGLSAYIGHENNTRFGYTRSYDGTKTLRGSLGTALAAEPDFINIPEWDEQNENTSLRPTVYNGLAPLRLVRYYMTKERGEALSPLEGDDVTLPNLVISYRRILVLGEKLEIELLNIPDGGEPEPYQATLTLETPEGKAVYTSPELDFDPARLADHTLTIASETLAGHTALRPRVEIRRDGKKRTIGDGLHYIGLRSTWNWDYKWVLQPVRDLLSPKEVTFTVSKADDEGVRTVSGSIEAKEPLAYVEVLDDGKTVYMAGQEGQETWRETEAQYVFSLRWQSRTLGHERKVIPGGVRLEGAAGNWKVPARHSRSSPLLKGETLEGIQPSLYAQRALLAVPRDAVAGASLVMNLEGSPRVTLPLEKLLKESIYGLPGPDRFNLVVSRYLQQDTIPLPLKREKAKFAVRLKPEHPASVYQLQAQGVSGKIYRSAPVLPGRSDEGGATVAVVSETEGDAIRVKVPARTVPAIDYDFRTDRGSVLTASAGRPFWAILGGFASLATDRGGGESNDASPFFHHAVTETPDAIEAPAWMRGEEDGDFLRFNGDGQFITLPQGVIPRRAGYTLTMEIRPEQVQRRQVLFRNASHYPGSLGIYLHNGLLKAIFLNENEVETQGANTFARVAAGVWSKVEVRFDQKTLRVAVNGKEGRPIAIQGPGIYDTVSAVGGFKGDWFKGDLRRLRVDHHAPRMDSVEE